MNDTTVPDAWTAFAAELRLIADDVEKLVGQPAPLYLNLSIHPFTPRPTDRANPEARVETVDAVDAVAVALLGRSAETRKMSSGTFHHTISGSRGSVGISILQQVADPAAGAPDVAAVTNTGLVDKTEQEARTLSAAIAFSEARREALRLTGRTTSERLLAATLDLLHEWALEEDRERARRADVRPGEQGRVLNPSLARFLAEKEEKRRVARHFLGLEESTKHYPAASEAR